MDYSKYKFINEQDRSKLSEGRNFGFGGGFAKVDYKKKTITTVSPITACADFYAEVIHTESTGKEWSVYGLKYKKNDIFKDNGFAYLVCSILLPNHGDKPHAEFAQEVKALEDNYKHIQDFINWFEDKLGIKNKTKVIKLAENLFLFKFDLFWTQGTYRISLYKFLQRAPIYFDGKQTPLEHLDAMKTGEAYTWKAIKPKLLDMLSGFIPEQVMTKDDTRPHNLGVQSFVWPRPLEKEKPKEEKIPSGF
jgi:hypothetical protein